MEAAARRNDFDPPNDDVEEVMDKISEKKSRCSRWIQFCIASAMHIGPKFGHRKAAVETEQVGITKVAYRPNAFCPLSGHVFWFEKCIFNPELI